MKKKNIINLALNDKPKTERSKEDEKFLELRVLESETSFDNNEFDAGTELLIEKTATYFPCIDCPEVAKANYNNPEENYKRCKDCEYK